MKPQKSAVAAKYEFDNRARKAGEMVSEYVAVLKHLATDYKFNNAMRLERLRDWFRLFEELPFDRAVAKYIAIEQSNKGC